MKNSWIDSDTLDLQEIKSGTVFLNIFDIFYFLILAAYIAIYISFVVKHGNLLKYIAATAQFFCNENCASRNARL